MKRFIFLAFLALMLIPGLAQAANTRNLSGEVNTITTATNSTGNQAALLDHYQHQLQWFPATTNSTGNATVQVRAHGSDDWYNATTIDMGASSAQQAQWQGFFEGWRMITPTGVNGTWYYAGGSR
jgi:type II secretory pathway pseudopilin PulG